MKSVSIVIPAYNEAGSISPLLERIREMTMANPQVDWDVVVVDDGSTDETAAQATTFSDVTVITQPNQGKGSAVRRGAQIAVADYLLVQDGDLEYDPFDIPKLVTAMKADRPTAVYGSRTLCERGRSSWLPRRTKGQSLAPYGAGIVLSAITGLIYRRWLTDTLTGYKLYRRKDFISFSTDTTGFETDHELTAKLLRVGVRIVEIPVSYQPRSKSEGKKIRGRDALVAVKTLMRYRSFGSKRPTVFGVPASDQTNRLDDGR